MSECLLELKGIYKSFGGVKALQDIYLQVFAGEVLCLAGENGCGKSTLIKIISGFYRPDQGSIFLNGKEHAQMQLREAIREGIQIVYQDFSVFPNLTVYENIDYFCGLYIRDKAIRKQYIEEAIALVGLE